MSQVTTPRRQRKTLSPVCGKVRVIQSVGSIGPACCSTGEIEINGKPYFICVRSGCYSLFGYDAKQHKPTHYDIAPDCSSCDCPDATFQADRPEGCKHVKAIRALIAAGKLPVIAGPVEDKASRADADDFIGDEEADALEQRWTISTEDSGFYSEWDAA